LSRLPARQLPLKKSNDLHNRQQDEEKKSESKGTETTQAPEFKGCWNLDEAGSWPHPTSFTQPLVLSTRPPFHLLKAVAREKK
jgi:hypothetical protein